MSFLVTCVKSIDQQFNISTLDYIGLKIRSANWYFECSLDFIDQKTTTTRTSRLSELMNRVKLLRGEIDRAFETHEDNAIFIEEAKDRCTLEKSKFNQVMFIVFDCFIK